MRETRTHEERRGKKGQLVNHISGRRADSAWLREGRGLIWLQPDQNHTDGRPFTWSRHNSPTRRNRLFLKEAADASKSLLDVVMWPMRSEVMSTTQARRPAVFGHITFRRQIYLEEERLLTRLQWKASETALKAWAGLRGARLNSFTHN